MHTTKLGGVGGHQPSRPALGETLFLEREGGTLFSRVFTAAPSPEDCVFAFLNLKPHIPNMGQGEGGTLFSREPSAVSTPEGPEEGTTYPESYITSYTSIQRSTAVPAFSGASTFLNAQLWETIFPRERERGVRCFRESQAPCPPRRRVRLHSRTIAHTCSRKSEILSFPVLEMLARTR